MEAYTAEEIKGIVEDVGLSAEIQTDEHNFVTINVSAGEVEWIIILGKELSPYQCMHLGAMTLVEDQPLIFANNWNAAHTSKIIATKDNETDTIYPSTDGQYVMTMSLFIPFFGSVSAEYLSYVVSHWHDEVCELMGFEELVEETDNRQSHSFELIDRLSQIELELHFRPRQSSRELARSLKTTKYEINNLLYRNTHRFNKEGVTPPLWSNRSELI